MLQRPRSRPSSFAGGDSPGPLRSRSSTCDSIQSGSSPSSSCMPSNRQVAFPSSQAGTSPKQISLAQQGASSPGSASSVMKNLAQTPTNSGSRKSLVSGKEVSYLSVNQ